MKTKTLGVDYISFEDFKAIQAGNNQIILTAESRNQLLKSKENVQKIVASGQTVYGINTGFGPLCDTKISEEQTRQLQHNLLISHAVGVGNPIKKELAKTMLVAKAHALAKGYSGVTLEVVERILLMVEKNIIPVVPEKGSVGASGDLAPLSHLFLPLIGEGKVWEGDQIISTKDALAKHNLQPLHLSAKEGLGLINGTQFILSHALHGLKKFEYLLNLADIVGALSLEAYEGSPSPFRAELHEIRPFKGTVLVAERMRKLLEDSGIAHSHIDCGRVQDPYSLRCIPQVHGASRNAFFHLQELAEIELNSVTDNPIVVSDEEAISGGNFHGQPLAMALDYATVAASELGNISDRRQYLLIEGKYGLPKLLTESSGLNSGFMIPQYTSAALCTENKTLCFPASADSIPTSLGQEDHVSMGSISGRKFNQVLDNVERILAIEIMYACQGLEFRRPKQTSPYLEQVFAAVREVCPKLEDDRLIGDDINNIIDLLQTESFQELIMKF
ncbi:histidine ammonia-lyase [Faecalibacter rhinopitheci]|uniref:Histidine ammonia-lyase n=1 Tax=Faecalibacter rhinopitheci TaxID=2779678 RepID=A0A8J7FPM1_9FLAO|nr:histidine ammonia-lyase [Faecalibacter rhinopitheci]MBF0597069.1 histidine ammonia-lyase [Faecalibacter rhinopitheci]